MSLVKKDTICAIATASGTAGISVIRMSGNDSHKIALSRFVKKAKNLTVNDIIPNMMYYGEQSYTNKGEDVSLKVYQLLKEDFIK